MQRVVAGLPKSYPRQVGLTCGETNAKSVIASFGVPYRPFRSSIWVRLFGYSLLNDLRQLLQAHGLSATIAQAGELDDASKIDVLRRHIDHGSPAILSIGNGYRRRGDYVPWARLLVGHYITVYGYDDAQRVFYIYDSYLRGDPPHPLPAGNDTRTYAELLRDWRGPIYYRLIGRNYAYLSVSRRPHRRRDLVIS
jgi:Butirosin biosynthesis protein H, N-terminal